MVMLVTCISSVCSAGIMTDPIAVLPFGKKLMVESDVRVADTEDARSAIEEELGDVADFDFITRTEIDRLVEEMRFQMTDLVDPASTVRLGRMLGAKYLVITNITGLSREGSSMYVHLTSKIIEVETGRIIASGRGEGKDGQINKAFYKAALNAVHGDKGIATKLGFKTR